MIDLTTGTSGAFGPGRTPELSFEINGKIVEVLMGCGVATVRSQHSTYTVNRDTAGIDFDELRCGQLIHCQIQCSFHRVMRAHVLDAVGGTDIVKTETAHQLPLFS